MSLESDSSEVRKVLFTTPGCGFDSDGKFLSIYV